jgi:hypothetical protein
MVAKLEQVLAQAESLPPQDRLRLIQKLTESILQQPTTPKMLACGAYSTGRKSNEEDFKIAEWRPTETELNGD